MASFASLLIISDWKESDELKMIELDCISEWELSLFAFYGSGLGLEWHKLNKNKINAIPEYTTKEDKAVCK